MFMDNCVVESLIPGANEELLCLLANGFAIIIDFAVWIEEREGEFLNWGSTDY